MPSISRADESSKSVLLSELPIKLYLKDRRQSYTYGQDSLRHVNRDVQTNLTYGSSANLSQVATSDCNSILVILITWLYF